MMFQIGQSFANFKIVRKLGEGGMGEVYLAEDLKLNRNVALKILLAEFFDDRERMERFTREARTAAKVSHPNVMAIHDMDVAKHEPSGRQLNYIVMEYIRGQSLTDYLLNRSSSTKEFLRIAQKVASGLAAAHKLGIVHRDIKSDNIIIEEQGEPKILDFGLAKPADSQVAKGDADSTNTVSRELTQEGKILGTVSYMSPEQVRGESVDTRADIFSYGVLLYRMFTGVSPFEAPDRVSVLAKILEGRHIPLRQKNEAVPAELERIVDKCLQKDANDRYQDTRDLVVDLRSLRRQYDSGLSDSSSISMQGGAQTVRSRWYSSVWAKLGIAVGSVAVLMLVAALVCVGSFSLSEKAAVGEDPLAFMENLGQTINKALADKGLPVDIGVINIPGLQSKENGLAILDFQNKTGDSAWDWLQAGLPEILLTDLAQCAEINLISRNRVLDCLTDKTDDVHNHGECIAAAKSLGAATALSGAFFKMGDKIRIDARLEDVRSGKILLGEKVIGDNPLALVDSLTQKIAQSLHVKAVLSDDRQVADITSSSPEAYKHYILGMEEFYDRRFDEAIEHYEEAIAIDSTFALPYMRIGMTYAFQGRQQAGTPYFAAAKRFEDRLPLREKNLLDIYSDIWFRSEFDEAYVKLRTFVGNYPDDKEARTFYAAFLTQIISDQAAALAQLDTVLMLDPKDLLAHEMLAGIYEMQTDYEKAIEHSKLIKAYHPNAPTSYENLASLYQRTGRLDEAARECKELLDIDPGNTSALIRLTAIYIMGRDFENVRKYAEMIKENHADDAYSMRNYYRILTNLANWQGKFKTAVGNELKALDQAMLTGDSSLIYSQYRVLANFLIALGMTDSAAVLVEQSADWVVQFQLLSHPFMLLNLGRENVPAARRMFGEALADFKSRVPSEMWELCDVLERVFEGYCDADTGSIIAASEEMLGLPNQESSGSLFELGELLVLYGRYEKGKEILRRVISGPRETNWGFRYLRVRYYMGIAEEGLGNVEEAIANYREVLKYWGDPEIELELITDTRERLGRLTT